MRDRFEVLVNAKPVAVWPETTAWAAIVLADVSPYRAALCGMGICFECRAEVDGVKHVKTCQTPCQPGMVIVVDAR